MIQTPQLAPQPLPVATPPQAPAPAFKIGPEITDALQKIAAGFSGPAGRQAVDKNSPEYKQAVMQQLAATGPMGAIGATMQSIGDDYKKAQKQKQADMAAWMPVVTPEPQG